MSHKTKFKTRIRWRDMKVSVPEDGQRCLFLMKYGLIEGVWDEEEKVGSSYIWRDISYFPDKWVPIEEVKTN